MRKDIMPIEVNKKPFEIVQELKDEYKIPSFEEFMKTYESDDKIISSYEDELEAKAVQGPQYGPGKTNFREICRKIKDELGYTISCRISCDSDSFDKDHTYSGVIVYLVEGSPTWYVPGGRACGRKGRSFYMIVRDTTDWGWKYPERLGKGGGIYHGWIVWDEFGHDLDVWEKKYRQSENIICCGGFAYMPNRSPKMQYTSRTLNRVDQLGGNANSDPELSSEEIKLVDFCWEEYTKYGPSHTIPDTYYHIP